MSEPTRRLGGRYEVGALIGRGGMAEVHLGTDTRLGRQVAIKMLRSDLARDASFLTRFRREAQSSAGLNHASIVAVYDSGEDHGVDNHGQPYDVPFIVMEYVEGKTLRETLTARGKLDPNEAARITEGILDALSYSHRMGIVHRDIKPANVMIGTDGSVKVMDFGIARAIADTNATMTQTQAVIGTAQYLSPEQAQGQSVDARSDLYSTGCLLFELLTGRPPFLGDSPVAIAYQHVGQTPPLPSSLQPGISRDMDAVVVHSLDKNREGRYQTAADFRADLQAVRLGRPVSAAARSSLSASTPSGGAATERLNTLGNEPTEVYAATPVGRPPAGPDWAESGGRTTVQPPAYRDDPFDRPTASQPAVGPPRREGRGAMIALWTIVGLIVLAGLGWGLNTYLDNQAREASMVTVPDVTNQPRATAQLNLTRAGLVPDVQTEASKEVQVDHVIRQTPEGAVRVSTGTTVRIVVSSGPEAVAVPDLSGRTEAEARGQLSDLGLDVGTVTSVDDSKVAKDRIIETMPPSGQSVAPGTKIDLRISSGKVTVPDLVGKTQNEAFTILTQAGLAPRTTYQQTADAPENNVIAQDHPSGTLLDAGAVVTITVAQATPPTPTPTPEPSPPSPSPSPTSPSPSPSPSAT